MDPYWTRPAAIKITGSVVAVLALANLSMSMHGSIDTSGLAPDVLGEVIEAPAPTTTNATTFTVPGPTSAPTVVEASPDALALVEAEPTVETTIVATTTTAIPATTAAPTTTAAPATTAAPVVEPISAVAPPPPAASDASETGVFITPRGVVTPVIARDGDGWQVETPCGIIKTLLSGTRVSDVDIVIDPGHGGVEPGAVGGSLTEKDLNLAVSIELANILTDRGYSVLLTRTTDIRMPIRARAAIANALEPDVFVSVHHNGGATRRSSDPGSEIFYDGGKPEARRLGTLIYDELQTELSKHPATWVDSVRQGVSARLRDDGADLYGIHRYTPDVVSVITEAGYLSNPSEAAVFAKPEVQRAEALAIANGIEQFLTSDAIGSGILDDFVDGSSSGTGGYDNCVDPVL